MTHSTWLKPLAASALAAVFAAAMTAPAAAETNTVRIAEQFGLLYVPLNIVVDKKLIEKHVKKAGLPEPKVELYKISGGANMNKALLANTLDFGAAGVGPALKLWGKSEGRFKAAFNMTDMPLKLVTNDPAVTKFEDYLTIKNHKIAVPAAKVSIQAVVIQMAAKSLWNDAEKIDSLVVSMTHPTALAAVLSGGQSVKSHFATLPFSYQELKSGKAHEVSNSYKMLGGAHTVLVMIAGKEFKEANPKTYQAVADAFMESYDWIAKNPAEAAEVFIRFTQSKLNPEEVKAMLSDREEVHFSGEPKKTMEFAKFLHSIGDIPEAKSWKDYYWENNHKMSGS